MKKTIIALMALTGVAPAASIGYSEMDSSQKSGVIQYWNDSFTITKDSDVWKDISTGESFTFSFDVSNICNIDEAKTIFSVAGSNNVSQKDDGKLQIRYSSDTGLVLLNTAGDNDETSYFDGSKLGSPTVSAYSSDLGLTATDSIGTVTTFTFVSDVTNKTFTIYKNGTQIDQWTNWDTDTGIEGIQAGSRWGGGYRVSGDETVDFDNITVWNRALTSAEVSGLVIPEPATATLSLLALAGLAARRRRR